MNDTLGWVERQFPVTGYTSIDTILLGIIAAALYSYAIFLFRGSGGLIIRIQRALSRKSTRRDTLDILACFRDEEHLQLSLDIERRLSFNVLYGLISSIAGMSLLIWMGSEHWGIAAAGIFFLAYGAWMHGHYCALTRRRYINRICRWMRIDPYQLMKRNDLRHPKREHGMVQARWDRIVAKSPFIKPRWPRNVERPTPSHEAVPWE